MDDEKYCINQRYDLFKKGTSKKYFSDDDEHNEAIDLISQVSFYIGAHEAFTIIDSILANTSLSNKEKNELIHSNINKINKYIVNRKYVDIYAQNVNKFVNKETENENS